jgi:hypothetical protein
MTRPRYVIEGPRWFRTQIRNRGPFVALLPPLVLGALSLLLLKVFSTYASGMTGLVLGFFAAPALPVLGAPFSSSENYPLAIGISVAFWLMIGLISARRSTRNPMATWSDYWRTYWWLAAGTWTGAAVSMIVARFVVGRELL